MRVSPMGAVKDGLGDRERLAVGAYVVDSEERSAFLVGEHGGGHGAEDALGRFLYPGDASYEPLARSSYEKGETEVRYGPQVAEQGQVVVQVLPEPDAGVHDDVLRPHTRRDSVLGPRLEKVLDLVQHVLIARPSLHGL